MIPIEKILIVILSQPLTNLQEIKSMFNTGCPTKLDSIKTLIFEFICDIQFYEKFSKSEKNSSVILKAQKAEHILQMPRQVVFCDS